MEAASSAALVAVLEIMSSLGKIEIYKYSAMSHLRADG